jgi:hypothetical protein
MHGAYVHNQTYMHAYIHEYESFAIDSLTPTKHDCFILDEGRGKSFFSLLLAGDHLRQRQHSHSFLLRPFGNLHRHRMPSCKYLHVGLIRLRGT